MLCCLVHWYLKLGREVEVVSFAVAGVESGDMKGDPDRLVASSGLGGASCISRLVGVPSDTCSAI